MKPGEFVRQGDVYVTAIAAPKNVGQLVPRDNGRVVLAYGEVTFHSHAIADPDVDLFETANAAERWLHVANKTATLKHDEHSAIDLAPGWYKVEIQREYSPAEIRRVID